MKAFKKTVCAALCLAMVFALCACGSQTNDKAKKTNENDNSQIANPVHESSAEEFKAAGIVMPAKRPCTQRLTETRRCIRQITAHLPSVHRKRMNRRTSPV